MPRGKRHVGLGPFGCLFKHELVPWQLGNASNKHANTKPAKINNAMNTGVLNWTHIEHPEKTVLT